MERLRRPFQGVRNIVRFNRHFFLAAAGAIVILSVISIANAQARIPAAAAGFLIAIPTVISLLVSYYIYDCSGLYRLDWLNHPGNLPVTNLVNVHAGFDETSALIASKFPEASLEVMDFYHAAKHREISIRRARKAYPPYPGTKVISTENLPLADASADLIVVMLAAHEIRDNTERILFFSALKKAIRDSGKIIVVEHLRDAANAAAYNVGAFHFLAKKTWLHTFREAGLFILTVQKITPFVTIFTLGK